MNVARPSNERESERKGARRGESRRPTRTCVGCGLRDDAAELLRLVAVEDEFAFDLAGGAFGRGAHLHARPACIEKAPRGLARGLRGAVKTDTAAIGRRLVEACDRRMAGLLLAARRSRALAIGADAAIEALEPGAPLGVVAVDAGGVATTAEVQRCIAAGRAMAWRTRSELGSLLGERSVAICAVRHAGIAAELKRMRVAADAGAAATTSATREGAECSRFPEAR
jgi:predicted RNA-binding protein YlxR (DUF448 family)